MNRTKSSNSVFPYLDDENQLQSIILDKKAYYDKRVKISDWQDRYLCEPRDNTKYFPPKGNLRIATYKALGSYDSAIYLSETKDKIRLYKSSDYNKCSQPIKLLNIFTFPLTDVNRKLEMKSNIENISKIKSKELPETLGRRTLGYSLEDLERLRGVRTFLDDDLEIRKKISDFKIKRFKR